MAFSEPTTSVDWFRFRTQAEPGAALDALRPLYGSLGRDLHFGDLARGALGFQRSMPVLVGDMPLGRFDFGGDSQRGWVRVDIGGKGCSFVQDWDAVDAVEALPSAELRRLDIALTSWQGQVTHERVVDAHGAGKFTTRGRPPNLEERTHSDARRGRTCYVGTRAGSDKFLRAYEKGFEMLGKMGPALAGTVTHIDGFKVEDIYRVEVELKAESTDIPWETIERRDQYFAGSYPFCAEILPGIEPDILQRRPEKGPQRELAAALANCRHQFGNTLFTALMAHYGDFGTVWEKIVGKDHNRALLEAGVLLVDHD
jgi:DNA relaxase NicK